MSNYSQVCDQNAATRRMPVVKPQPVKPSATAVTRRMPSVKDRKAA